MNPNCQAYPCLASKARLKTSKSHKPIPLLSFDFPIISQLIQDTLLALIWELHQNLLIKELRLWHRVFGRRKTLILYVGIACITALMRISLPAWERNLSIQPSKTVTQNIVIVQDYLIICTHHSSTYPCAKEKLHIQINMGWQFFLSSKYLDFLLLLNSEIQRQSN
jgi:hypothetical protein